MIVHKSPDEISDKLARFANLWNRAASGDFDAMRELDVERCRAIRRWRERAMAAESAIRSVREGGVN